MNRKISQRWCALHASNKLLAAIAAALGIQGLAAAAVTSCADDGGFDTLRHAVTVANDGDTIDLSALACSKITLGSAISTGLYNLTLAGPGASRLTIDGNQADRVLVHTPTGPGTLTISDLTIANGKFSAAKAYGGCIYSKGSVVLSNAVVTSCTVVGQTLAAGGGIVAVDALKVYSSTISGNVAEAQAGVSGMTSVIAGGAFVASTVSGGMYLYGSLISGNTAESAVGRAYGGGVGAYHLVAKYSTFTGNHAIAAGTGDDLGIGGGLDTTNDSELLNCTLDNNVADGGGGMNIQGVAGYTAAIIQTTISSNTANIGAGGILVNGSLQLLNSTIAFNVSNGPSQGGGLLIGTTMSATSTIIADNSPTDVDSGGPPVTIGGDHDLIKIAGPNVTVPSLTITLDPDLGPLAFNGGYVRTHALNAGSIAIDAGSNDGNLANDQRGPPYKRVAGSSADIGAYEFDADHIFGNGFNFGSIYP